MREVDPKSVIFKSKIIRDGCMQGEWEKLIAGILNDAKNFSNVQILENLKRTSALMQADTGIDYWTTGEGQSELLRRIQSEAKPVCTSRTASRAWEIHRS